MLYLEGNDVARNPQVADAWFEKAAQNNHAPAQFQLALMYAAGNGVHHDLERALTLCERAAEFGHPAAQYRLAVMLANGDGCDPDQGRSASWLKKAAEQGFAENDGAHALLVDLDSFDAIRRNRAFDQGMLSQSLELLRRLLGEQLLLAQRLRHVGQVPGSRGRNDRGFFEKLA